MIWIRTTLALLLLAAVALGGVPPQAQAGRVMALAQQHDGLVHATGTVTKQTSEARRADPTSAPMGGGLDEGLLPVTVARALPDNRLRRAAAPRAPPPALSARLRVHPVRAPPHA